MTKLPRIKLYDDYIHNLFIRFNVLSSSPVTRALFNVAHVLPGHRNVYKRRPLIHQFYSTPIFPFLFPLRLPFIVRRYDDRPLWIHTPHRTNGSTERTHTHTHAHTHQHTEWDLSKHWLAITSILLIVGAAGVAVPLALRVSSGQYIYINVSDDEIVYLRSGSSTIVRNNVCVSLSLSRKSQPDCAVCWPSRAA